MSRRTRSQLQSQDDSERIEEYLQSEKDDDMIRKDESVLLSKKKPYESSGDIPEVVTPKKVKAISEDHSNVSIVITNEDPSSMKEQEDKSLSLSSSQSSASTMKLTKGEQWANILSIIKYMNMNNN